MNKRILTKLARFSVYWVANKWLEAYLFNIWLDCHLTLVVIDTGKPLPSAILDRFTRKQFREMVIEVLREIEA